MKSLICHSQISQYLKVKNYIFPLVLSVYIACMESLLKQLPTLGCDSNEGRRVVLGTVVIIIIS